MEKKSKTENVHEFQLFSEEIIAEILSRLPVESIMVCRCVCKAWNSLTKDVYFIKLHLARSQTNKSSSHILLETFKVKSKTKLSFTSVSMKRYLYNVENCNGRKIPVYPHVQDKKNIVHMKLYMPIISSLHGLICFSAPCDSVADDVVVYNPMITGDYVRLSGTIGTRTRGYKTLTLGFDIALNKYKVVNLVLRGNNYIGGCDVVTIGKDISWRQVDFPYTTLTIFHYQGIFHQGSAYYMIRDVENDNGCILEFDFTKEVFSIVSFPSSIRQPAYRNRYRILLQSMGEYLNLTERESRSVYIWRLTKQTSGCSEVVEYRSMKIKPPSKYAMLRSDFTFLNNSEDLLLLITHGGFEPKKNENGERVRTPGTHFSFYSPASKKKNRLVNLTDFPSTFTEAKDVRAWCFKPSLVSIKQAMLN